MGRKKDNEGHLFSDGLAGSKTDWVVWVVNRSGKECSAWKRIQLNELVSLLIGRVFQGRMDCD